MNHPGDNYVDKHRLGQKETLNKSSSGFRLDTVGWILHRMYKGYRIN
jgi:hypothetical protein